MTEVVKNQGKESRAGRNGGTQPTMADVARLARVSTSTASRALSGARPVKPALAAAVLEAATAIGYRPNIVARNLRKQSTQAAGMIVPNLTNPFFGAMAQLIAGQLDNEGWHLIIADLGDEVGQEHRRLEWLESLRVDAAIMIPVSAFGGQRIETPMPLIQIDRQVAATDSVFVSTDHTHGMELLVSHLSSLGRDRLAFVGAEPVNTAAQARLRAFVALAGQHATTYLGDFSVHWGRAAAARILAAGPLPHAVVCANDLIALGVIQGLQAAGVAVPGDIAVTGFDDIVFAEMSHPALTTARQPIEQIADAAVTTMFAMLRGSSDYSRVQLFAPELVVRASTTPDPAQE